MYRRTEKFSIYADDPKFDDKREQYQKAQAFFDRFKNPDGSYRGGFTDYTTPTDFVSWLEKDLKTILQKRLEAAPSPPPAASLGMNSPVWTGSPYPGLRPFDITEAAIFFGRGRETDALIARLRDPHQRFLAVVGASGSGKSSLVRAGLLPRLQQGAIEGSRHWRVLTLTPGAAGGNPFLALAFELARELPPSTRKPAIKIAEELANEPQRVTEYAATLLAGSPGGGALVLFVDQMEELFTSSPIPIRPPSSTFWRMRPAIRGCECWPRCGRTFSPKPWPSPPSGRSSRHRREPICSRPPIRWHWLR